MTSCVPCVLLAASLAAFPAAQSQTAAPIGTPEGEWYQMMSGTSMATPHVAGGAALYLHDHPDASPAEVAAHLTSTATQGALCNVPPNTANSLLYVGP